MVVLTVWFLVTPSMSYSAWRIEVIDATTNVCNFSQRAIAIDSSNRPHIAYGNDYLSHAYFDGTQWQYEVVDNSAGTAMFASIAVDSNNMAHISYYDCNNSGDSILNS